MELLKVRPVLSADDLHFIIDGLTHVRSTLGKQAIALSKGGEYEAAGETLSLGTEVNDLMERMEGLRDRVMDDMVRQTVERSVAESGETDEVGTIPLTEAIEAAEAASQAALEAAFAETDEDDPNVDHSDA